MPADCQASVQIASSSPANHTLRNDIAAIVALVLCLLAGSWVTFHVCRTLASLSLEGRVVVSSFASFLFFTTRGVFLFFCGYWLARLLRRVSPWYVVGGLAIVAVLLICVLTGVRPRLDVLDGSAVTAAPFFLAADVFRGDCLLLLLCLGIWYQRRVSGIERERS